jgi:hypothetical protein
VEEAERFAKEDAEQKERIEAKNSMEEQLYRIKSNQAVNVASEEIKKEYQEIVSEYDTWHLDNPGASKEEFETKTKEMNEAVQAFLKEKGLNEEPTAVPTPDFSSQGPMSSEDAQKMAEEYAKKMAEPAAEPKIEEID